MTLYSKGWRPMLRLFIPAVLLLAAASGAAYWMLARDGGAEAGVQEIRWGNITVQVTQDSGVLAAGDYARTPDQRPVLLVKKGDSFVHLDAETGVIVQEKVSDSDRPGIQAVLATMQVSRLDTATAPWPYGPSAPTGPRERWGNITYIRPDTASGIAIRGGIGDFGSQGSVKLISVSNGRSGMVIDAETGLVFESTQHVAAEDADAFRRFLSEVQLVEP